MHEELLTPPTPVRRVVTRLESTVCEEAELASMYSSTASGPHKVHALLVPLLEDQAVEVFACLQLNGKHRIFGYEVISRGTLTTSLVHPREVFGAALRLGSAAIIVAHNHPSGDPEPSDQDVEVTLRLIQAGKLLGVPLLDHLIIGQEGSYRSLRAVMEF